MNSKSNDSVADQTVGAAKTICLIGASTIKAFGKTPAERLEVQSARLNLTIVEDTSKADIFISGKCVYGMSILRALIDAAPGVLLLDNEGQVAAVKAGPGVGVELLLETQRAPDDLTAKTGAELAGRYDKKLRKRTDPMVVFVRDSLSVEQALFDASYKGVTDFVTKHVWPFPALHVTRWCALRNISPNQVTWASAVLVVATFWLFWTGQFGPGLVAAWAMTFLDTVDGKLARVTLSSSKFGDFLDHGIDLVHPPFWWWAFAIGLSAIGTPLNDGGLILGIIVVGYVLQRIEEGIFIACFGIEMHIWRSFDSFFRQITARRNPNLVILTLATLTGFAKEGLILVGLWTGLCLFVHLIQIVQAFIAKRHGPLNSWLAHG